MKKAKSALIDGKALILWDSSGFRRIPKKDEKELRPWAMKVEKILQGTKKLSEDKIEEYGILDEFLKFVSSFVVLISTSTGYFFRGGVSIGAYVEKNVGGQLGNLFIYSEALNEASEMEKKADVPRILISEKVITYYSKKYNSDPTRALPIIKSGDGFYFLDIYSAFDFDRRGFDYESDLVDLQVAVMKQCVRNISNRKVLDKYLWFKEYHNSKVVSFLKDGKTSHKGLMIGDLPYKI